MSRESASVRQVSQIESNMGFESSGMLRFLSQNPRVSQIMNAYSFAFIDRSGDWKFPTTVLPEGEKTDPELANQAFRGRVARHTTAVGMTMNMILTELESSSDVGLDSDTIRLATEVMVLHDIGKLEEILLRQPLGSSGKAYDLAEDHVTDLLLKAGYPPEFVQLPGSIGHNGARDFVTAPLLWPLIRQAAYLSDELLQETVIQPDITAKSRRLQTDTRYADLNNSGFPERSYLPQFTNPDQTLRPKYKIQEEATIQMAINLSDKFMIEWSDLGRFLIQTAVEREIYRAELLSSPN